jgi:hypothetical protein
LGGEIMMTEEQIEKAARILCAKHGEDPDQRGPVANSDARCMVYSIGPLWMNYRQTIIRHLMIEEAIKESYAP